MSNGKPVHPSECVCFHIEKCLAYEGTFSYTADDLTKGMGVVGLGVLRAFLEAKRGRPFAYADLKRVLKHSEAATANANADTDDWGETEDLGHASPCF